MFHFAFMPLIFNDIRKIWFFHSSFVLSLYVVIPQLFSAKLVGADVVELNKFKKPFFLFVIFSTCPFLLLVNFCRFSYALFIKGDPRMSDRRVFDEKQLLFLYRFTLFCLPGLISVSLVTTRLRHQKIL